VLRSIFQSSPPYFGYLGNKGSSRSRVADVVPSLLETEEREGRLIDGVAYHITIPRMYRELEGIRGSAFREARESLIAWAYPEYGFDDWRCLKGSGQSVDELSVAIRRRDKLFRKILMR